MAAKSQFNLVKDIPALIKKNNVLPIYFLFGDDSFLINQTAELLEKELSPLVGSDFDKESYYGSKANIFEIIDYALAFPFSSGKKLIIVKEFDKIKNGEQLVSYIQSPSDYTILILIHLGSIPKFDKEYLRLLAQHGYAFEAPQLKDEAIINWIKDYVKENKKQISDSDARYLTELAGESRDILKMQLDKMFVYMHDSNALSLQLINQHVIPSKEYNIFQLQDAIAQKQNAQAMKIALRILEKDSIAKIIYPLNKYFTGLLQVSELEEKRTKPEIAARIVGTHPYYYPKFVEASKRFSFQKLNEIFKALLEADIALKTTSTNEKTVLTMLMTRILK